MTDLLNDASLRSALGARPLRFEAHVGSTNDIARDWALNAAPTGSVVLAEEQDAGRGRFGRVWSVAPGTALLMSVILRPRLAPDRIGRMAMVGAVAVGEALDALAPGHVSLKWPNDVWLDGRKAAGILPESIWQGEKLVAVILGIGLNVRVDFTGTPLADRATSVETVTGKPVDRLALLADVLRRLDFWSARVDETPILDRWRDWLATIGQRVCIHSFGRESSAEIVGQAVAIDEAGALIVQSDNGIIHRVIAGEVTLTDPPPGQALPSATRQAGVTTCTGT